MKKTFLAILLGFCGALTLAAQAPSAGETEEPARQSGELDALLAPIALYPDPLVALILPASCAPADIALAAAYLDADGDPAQIAGQPWDDSVKSLAHYPDIVKWMNENTSWTRQLGEAFLVQPADVMKSIQQLRARAIAAGSLTDVPQQQVLTDGGEIRIVPAQPDMIYVPRYDSDLVYDEQPSYAGPWLTFGRGFPAGVWLNYDLDWNLRGIWIGAWHPGFDYRYPQWRHPAGRAPVAGHPWRPAPSFGAVGMRTPGIIRPKAFPGAPRGAPATQSPAATGFRATGPVGFGQSESRGYPPANQGRSAAARPAPAPSGVFGGYNRGSDVRDASERGRMSRQGGGPSGRSSAPPPSRSGSSPAPAPRSNSSPGSTPRSSSGPGDPNRWK